MNKTDPIESLSRRILGRLEYYEPSQVWEGHREPSDRVLGIYRPGVNADIEFVIGAESIYVNSVAGWTTVPYRQITGVESPASRDPDAKHTIDAVHVRTAAGEHVTIKVSGGKGRFRDAWEVVRFLDRAANAARGRHGPSTSSGTPNADGSGDVAPASLTSSESSLGFWPPVPVRSTTPEEGDPGAPRS